MISLIAPYLIVPALYHLPYSSTDFAMDFSLIKEKNCILSTSSSICLKGAYKVYFHYIDLIIYYNYSIHTHIIIITFTANL